MGHKYFEMPSVTIILFDKEDVIVTSDFELDVDQANPATLDS